MPKKKKTERNKKKVIGIVGTRRRDEDVDYYKCLSEVIKIWNNGDTFVSGGCPRGGDRFAEKIAKNFETRIKIHKADWEKNGKTAGFKRNILVAQDCDVLIAVVAKDRMGGTEDTLRKAQRLGKEIILVK